MSAVFSIHAFQSRTQVNSADESKWVAQAKAMLNGGIAAAESVLRARRTPRLAAELRDDASGLYNCAGLMASGGALLDEARCADRALGLIVFDFNDMPEVRAIYGTRIANALGQQIVKKLKAIAGVQGLVARTGRTQFAVLLPGHGRERALKAVQRVLGHPARVELDSHGEEIVLVPDLAADNIAPGDELIAQLHGEMLRELAQQRVDEDRRCHYLQRERERHSRPMHLVSLPPQGAVPLARHAKTVPMPLSVRR